MSRFSSFLILDMQVVQQSVAIRTALSVQTPLLARLPDTYLPPPHSPCALTGHPPRPPLLPRLPDTGTTMMAQR